MLYLFLYLLDAGCSTEEKMISDTSVTEDSINTYENSQYNWYNTTNTYKKKLADNLYVDAIVDAPKVEKIAALKAEGLKFDCEKLLNVFKQQI